MFVTKGNEHPEEFRGKFHSESDCTSCRKQIAQEIKEGQMQLPSCILCEHWGWCDGVRFAERCKLSDFFWKEKGL